MSPDVAPQPQESGARPGPRATRPSMTEYGIPPDTAGLLPWSHVTERMVAAPHYWVCTVDPNDCPHATPVDGLWLDDQLYFGGSPHTRRQRNLAENPRVCIHLESGTDVVILHGTVQALPSPDATLSHRLAEAASRKYGYAVQPEDYTGAGLSVFCPHTVFAWRNFPTDATRWSIVPDHP